MLDSLAAQGFFRGVAVQIHDIGPLPQRPATAPSLLGQSSGFTSALEMRHLPPQVRIVQILDRRWRLELHPPNRCCLPPSACSLGGWAQAAACCRRLRGFVSWLVRRHARALKTSEANFKAIFNQATVGIALADTQTGHLLQTNARCAHILGYTAQELATRTFQELVDPQDLSQAIAQRQRLLKGEIQHDTRIERRMRHKDGRTIWVDVNISPCWPTAKPPPTIWPCCKTFPPSARFQEMLCQREAQQRNILNHMPVASLGQEERRRHLPQCTLHSNHRL